MAEKRMFAKQIIDSDAFLEMPLSTQALYFHLSMRADDDGFIDNPKKIQRMVSASGDDLKLLIAKRYVLSFESGVIVIKHWRIHNTLRNDRYKETVYLEEKALLNVKDNRSYTEKLELKSIGIPNGNQLEPQIRLDKISKDIDNNNIVQKNCTVSKNDIENLFESMWKLYPNKKGKGKISDAKKKKLYEVGLEKISIAIQRYKEELKKDEWRKQQNGSTFFNSGYVDYLDGNFEPSKGQTQVQKQNTKIHNFPERDYKKDDYASMEQRLLNKER